MTTDVQDHLMYATLALDSYHRGYDARVALQGSIGDATFIAEHANESNGFYAAAYRYNGQIVISYRGTDDTSFSLENDAINGWALGGGLVYENSQVYDALSFYQSLAGPISDGPASNVVLTGHSLGGGLAGIVGAVTGTDAVLFDHMPFGPGALAVWTGMVHNAVQRQAAGEAVPLPPFPDATHMEAYYAHGEALQYLRSGAAQYLGAAFADNLQAGHYLAGISGNDDPIPVVDYVQDQIAQFGIENAEVIRFFERQIGAESGRGSVQIDTHDIDQLVGDGPLSPDQTHSQSLLIALMYAEQNGFTDWHQISGLLVAALFNDDVATAANVPVVGGLRGPADKMLALMAYSAVGVGQAGQGPFGDNALSTLFSDAQQLAQVIDLGADFATDSAIVKALAEVIVQRAAYDALAGVTIT